MKLEPYVEPVKPVEDAYDSFLPYQLDIINMFSDINEKISLAISVKRGDGPNLDTYKKYLNALEIKYLNALEILDE